MKSIKAKGNGYLTNGSVFAKEIFFRDGEEYYAVSWKNVEDTEPEISDEEAVRELLNALYN